MQNWIAELISAKTELEFFTRLSHTHSELSTSNLRPVSSPVHGYGIALEITQNVDYWADSTIPHRWRGIVQRCTLYQDNHLQWEILGQLPFIDLSNIQATLRQMLTSDIQPRLASGLVEACDRKVKYPPGSLEALAQAGLSQQPTMRLDLSDTIKKKDRQP